MRKAYLLSGMTVGMVAGAFAMGRAAMRRRRTQKAWAQAARWGAGTGAGALLAVATKAALQLPKKLALMEQLMPKPQMTYMAPQVAKEVPTEYFASKGSGTDFETRASAWEGFTTPTERFYVRSHNPAPRIDVDQWRLKVEGTGVRHAIELRYEDLQKLPQIKLTRTMECAGNGRRFFKEQFGVEAEGGQWRTGAMGNAEWSGVRLRDVLEMAGLKQSAVDVMPEGLDEHEVKRPMPVEKALRDDTLLALQMNGEALPVDHGFPARVIASGWTGTANIKWVGKIQVADEKLYSPYNTMEYVMVGPEYPMEFPAMGPAITEMPVMSALDLDWPAEVTTEMRRVHGRSYAGEGKVAEVLYSVDNGEWSAAELGIDDIEGCWRQWSFAWTPTKGKHEIRVRATDNRGRTQPDHVPWNHHGYLYNAVVAHPVTVT